MPSPCCSVEARVVRILTAAHALALPATSAVRSSSGSWLSWSVANALNSNELAIIEAVSSVVFIVTPSCGLGLPWPGRPGRRPPWWAQDKTIASLSSTTYGAGSSAIRHGMLGQLLEGYL